MADKLNHKTPLLARAVFLAATRGAERDSILGDLEEEFCARAERSPGEARRWYWRQALLSAPHLASAAFQTAAAQRTALALAGLFGAFVFMHYWDVFVARNAARGFYSLTGGGYGPARTLFMIVTALGAGLAGAAFARLAAAPHLSRAGFVLRRALPAALILAIPAFVQMLAPAENYPTGFILAQTILGAFAFVAGGALGARRK